MIAAVTFLLGLYLGWHSGCSWPTTVGGLFLATLLALLLAGLCSLAGVAVSLVRSAR